MRGEVPSGWTAGTLAQIAEESRDRFLPGQESDASIPYVGLEHIEPGVSRVRLFGSADEVSSQKTAFASGDVLFGKLRPYLKKVAQVDRAGVCSTDILALRPRPGTDAGFLLTLLSHDEIIQFATRTSAGTKMPRTSWSSLSEFPVLLPPLPEQKKIAAILSSVDEAIQATQAVIDQTRRVKEGLLQDLLTRGMPGRHTRFKQTEIGEIPEGWEVRPARDFARKGDLVGGPFGSDLGAADYTESGVPVIRGGNVVLGKFIEADFVYVSIEKAALLGRNSARRGDVVMTQRGASLGEAALIPTTSMFESYVISQTMMRLRPNTDAVDRHFLLLSICSDRAQAWLKSRAIGNAQPHLNLSIWQDMPLAFAPKKEQEEIALRVGSLDDAVMESEAALVELQGTKYGLLQDLLTGKVRVSV